MSTNTTNIIADAGTRRKFSSDIMLTSDSTNISSDGRNMLVVPFLRVTETILFAQDQVVSSIVSS